MTGEGRKGTTAGLQRPRPEAVRMVVQRKGMPLGKSEQETGVGGLPFLVWCPGQDVQPGTVPAAGGSLGPWLAVGPGTLPPGVTVTLPGLSTAPYSFVLNQLLGGSLR